MDISEIDIPTVDIQTQHREKEGLMTNEQGQQAPQNQNQPPRVDVRVEPRQNNGGNNRVPLEDRIASAMTAALDARDRQQQPRAASAQQPPAAPVASGVTSGQFWGGVAAVCVVAILATAAFRTPGGGSSSELNSLSGGMTSSAIRTSTARGAANMDGSALEFTSDPCRLSNGQMGLVARVKATGETRCARKN